MPFNSALYQNTFFFFLDPNHIFQCFQCFAIVKVSTQCVVLNIIYLKKQHFSADLRNALDITGALKKYTTTTNLWQKLRG